MKKMKWLAALLLCAALLLSATPAFAAGTVTLDEATNSVFRVEMCIRDRCKRSDAKACQY